MKELISYIIVTISLLSALQQITSGFGGGGARGGMGGGMIHSNLGQMPQIPQSLYPAKRSKYR